MMADLCRRAGRNRYGADGHVTKVPDRLSIYSRQDAVAVINTTMLHSWVLRGRKPKV
jgi:hypothetical protein